MRTLLLCVLVAGCAPAAKQVTPTADVTTVIVVRHAEKAAEPKADPPLTAEGAARAELLVEALRSLKVTAVFSTDYARTKSTAAPVAASAGVTTQIVDAKATDHPKQVADAVLARHRGSTVLVVGHSNTVPDIVAALGAPKPADICDLEFDNLYVVTVPASGPATAERRTYGTPNADLSCRSK